MIVPILLLSGSATSTPAGGPLNAALVTQGWGGGQRIVSQWFGFALSPPLGAPPAAAYVTQGFGTGQRLVTQWFGFPLVPPPPLAPIPVGVWTVPALIFTWAVPVNAPRRQQVPVTDIPLVTLRRYPEWSSVAWGFDFAHLPQVVAGETLSAPAIANLSGDPSLTVASPVVSGTQVLFSATGGTAGKTALLKCTVTLSGGETISWHGRLYSSN